MKCLRQHPKPALILKDQHISYTRLLECVTAYAGFLPVDTCEKVAIYSENRLEWVYALYAAWKNHCIAVPIDFMATIDEVAYILEDCKPDVLFCSRDKEQDAREALKSISYTPQLLVFEALEENGQTMEVTRDLEFPERDNNETALIIYTSGTTGSPKGAMISFGNIWANTEGVTEIVPIITAEQRVMLLLPLHHIFPLLGTLVMPLYIGGTCVFSPSMASEDILETLQQHAVTIILGVPRLYNLIRKGIRDKIDRSAIARTLFTLAERIDSPAFSKRVFKTVHQRFGGKVRFLICGGAAIDNDVARDYKTLGFDLLTGFGMTEAAPMISFTRPGTLKIGASGQALPGVEIKIVDGEIVARGRNIMQGYYQRPEETGAILKDGWLYTGDLGYLDDEGFVFVTGRKKDIIVLPNGKNINPEEIEFKILKNFNVVREIGVLMHNDSLHAVIYPDFKNLQEQGIHHIMKYMRWDVLDKYNQTASPAKKISQFTLVKEELPKTRLGKIRRFQLPALIQEPDSPRAQQKEPDFPEYGVIKTFLSEQTQRSIAPGDHLELDLGLDSLDKVSLLTFLSDTFGVDLHGDEILHHLTVENIAGYVREKGVKMNVEGVNWHKILHEDVQVALPNSYALHVPTGMLLKLLLSGYFHLTATGLEHVPDSACIFAANHQSYLDALVVSRFFKAELVKRCYFYADQIHFQKWWQQLFARNHNIIIVDINRKLKLSLQTMAAVLKSGKNMMIFPEGVRSRDGRLGEFKKTFAILSRELNIPIVPVVLQGAYEAMPIGQALPKFRHPIQVNFLPPMFPENLSYEALTDEVYQKIKQYLGE